MAERRKGSKRVKLRSAATSPGKAKEDKHDSGRCYPKYLLIKQIDLNRKHYARIRKLQDREEAMGLELAELKARESDSASSRRQFTDAIAKALLGTTTPPDDSSDDLGASAQLDDGEKLLIERLMKLKGEADEVEKSNHDLEAEMSRKSNMLEVAQKRVVWMNRSFKGFLSGILEDQTDGAGPRSLWDGMEKDGDSSLENANLRDLKQKVIELVLCLRQRAQNSENEAQELKAQLAGKSKRLQEAEEKLTLESVRFANEVAGALDACGDVNSADDEKSSKPDDPELQLIKRVKKLKEDAERCKNSNHALQAELSSRSKMLQGFQERANLSEKFVHGVAGILGTNCDQLGAEGSSLSEIQMAETLKVLSKLLHDKKAAEQSAESAKQEVERLTSAKQGLLTLLNSTVNQADEDVTKWKTACAASQTELEKAKFVQKNLMKNYSASAATHKAQIQEFRSKLAQSKVEAKEKLKNVQAEKDKVVSQLLAEGGQRNFFKVMRTLESVISEFPEEDRQKLDPVFEGILDGFRCIEAERNISEVEVWNYSEDLFNRILSLPLVVEVNDKERLLAAWLSRAFFSKTGCLPPFALTYFQDSMLA